MLLSSSGRVARSLALAAALALVGGCSAESPSPPTGTETCDALPFPAGEIVIDPAGQTFNPTGEFIFPSIFPAAEHLSDPLGQWYLYYAPHEAPGGIAVAYSDSLDGPWTEHEGNPIVSTAWSELSTVSHISSGDVVWNEAAGRAVMYFHGENDTTRYAVSADGVNFEYGGIALEAAEVGETTTEVSYARVFPSPTGDGWGMFFMEKSVDEPRAIRVARSTDGFTWEPDDRALIQGNSVTGVDVSGANLWVSGESLRVVYHASSGAIYARDVDEQLTTVGEARELYSQADAADAERVAAPEIVESGGSVHLFYETGARLTATIASTSAPVDEFCQGR